jgi:hypothetical protein
VATEEHLRGRGRGLARRLVAQAARRVAEAAGFPDTGWSILGLPVAS